MIRMERVVLDFLGVNSYIIWDEETKRALILDPGSSAQRILDAVTRLGVQPEAVLLTHAHVDHIGRVPEICQAYDIPVWLHADEQPIYLSQENHLKPWAGPVEGLPMPLQGACPTAGMNIQPIHTPGHTPGGCCYYLPEQGWLFSGDTMFRGTYGRTDFPGGSHRALMASIREKLLKLPPETRVFPGHEGETTIADEAGLYC